MTCIGQLQLDIKPLEENLFRIHHTESKVFLFTWLQSSLPTCPHLQFKLELYWSCSLSMLQKSKTPSMATTGYCGHFSALSCFKDHHDLSLCLNLQSFPCFSCPMGYTLLSPCPSKSTLTKCSPKYAYSSLMPFSLFFSQERSCHDLNTGSNGRNHVELLLCWEVLTSFSASSLLHHQWGKLPVLASSQQQAPFSAFLFPHSPLPESCYGFEPPMPTIHPEAFECCI